MASTFSPIGGAWLLLAMTPMALILMCPPFLAVRGGRISPAMRARLSEQAMEVPQYRVWMEVHRDGSCIGYDIGSLVFADGWLTFVGAATHFSVTRSQVNKLITGLRYLGRRDMITAELQDGSAVAFTAIDPEPVVLPSPRNQIARYTPPNDLSSQAKAFRQNPDLSPPTNSAIFPPLSPQGPLTVPNWAHAATAALAMQICHLCVAASFVARATGEAVGLALGIVLLHVGMVAAALLPTYARGFPTFGRSELGQWVLTMLAKNRSPMPPMS